MTLAIGKATYGNKNKKNNWRIQDGDNIYRILPPVGRLASEGKWAVFEVIHWGYRGTNGMKPFKCIQKKNFKTKMVTVQCPECDKIAEVKATRDATFKQKMDEGLSETQAKDFVKPLDEWLFSHNLDKKWYLNVMKEDQTMGRLAVPHKSYQSLQTEIENLVSNEGIDPIDIQGGVWFNFNRTGKGNQTVHAVKTVMADEVLNGRKVKSIKPAPLTGDVLERIAKEAFDLSDSFRGLTYDEIKRLVDSNGDAEEVDHVFSSPETNDAGGPDDDEPNPGESAAMPTRSNAMTKTDTSMVQSLAKSEVENAEARIRAEIEAEFRARLAATKPATKSVSVPQSDDDFIAQFGFSKK